MKKFNNPFSKFFANRNASTFSENSASERTVTPTSAPATDTTTEDIVINVVAVPSTRNWVFSSKSPANPMPSNKGFSETDVLPTESAASPMSWFFPDCYSKRNGLLLEISDTNKAYFPLAYTKEAMGIQKVFIGLDSTGILIARAWGCVTNSNKLFEVDYITDVRTLFIDCVTSKNNVGLSSNLADFNFVYNRLKNTIAMDKVAYGLSYNGAEDVFDILIVTVASAIVRTTANVFTQVIQPELTRLEHYLEEKLHYLEWINAQLNQIICKATHSHNKTDSFIALQEVLSNYMELEVLFDSTRETAEYFNFMNQKYETQLDLTKINYIYARDIQVYNRIISSFQLW